MTHRQPMIVGNWKMYKTIEESIAYIKGLLPLLEDISFPVYLAVPFTAIKTVADLCRNKVIVVGGQNMHAAREGAFTGEIGGRMLREAGAQFVLVGHSERRRFFGEGNDDINKKVLRALKEGLRPILCIGETAGQRERGDTEDILGTQLSLGLEGVVAEQASQLAIAYEPVWAIGTSKVASPETAEHAHSFCRRYLGRLFGPHAAEMISILYGGSVNPANAQALLEQPDVDGLLVGSASLDTQAFAKIIHCAIVLEQKH